MLGVRQIPMVAGMDGRVAQEVVGEERDTGQSIHVYWARKRRSTEIAMNSATTLAVTMEALVIVPSGDLDHVVEVSLYL